jgi:hypothetical protein
VMSYMGVLNWGLMACRETVQGADKIAELIPVALDELLLAAGLPAGKPIGIAPKRVSAEGPARSEKVEKPHRTPTATKATKEPAAKEAAAKQAKATESSPRDRSTAGVAEPSISITDVSVGDELATDIAASDIIPVPGIANGVSRVESQ